MSGISLTRRQFLVGASSGLALASVAACSGGGDAAAGKTALTWSTWGTADELKRMTAFTADFNTKNPSIQATLQPVPSYADYHSKLLTQLSSHTGPDVFYIGDDNLGKLISTKTLLPLQDKLSSTASQSKPDAFGAGLWGAAKDGATIWAVPNDCNPDMFWYDKSALKAASITEDPATLAAQGKWTTEVFMAMCAKLKAAGLKGAVFWNYWSTHWSWVVANGGKVFDDAGAFVLPDDPTSMAALTSLGKAFTDGLFLVADKLPQGGDIDTLFITHKAGFAVQGRYTIADTEKSGHKDLYDVAPWPTPSGAPTPSGVALSYLAINGKTKNPDQAFPFLTAYVSSAGQKFRLTGGGNAVPSVTGADEVVLDGYPAHAKTIVNLRDKGFVDFAPEAKVSGLASDISEKMLLLYQGKADVTSTVKSISDLVKAGGGK